METGKQEGKKALTLYSGLLLRFEFIYKNFPCPLLQKLYVCGEEQSFTAHYNNSGRRKKLWWRTAGFLSTKNWFIFQMHRKSLFVKYV